MASEPWINGSQCCRRTSASGTELRSPRSHGGLERRCLDEADAHVESDHHQHGTGQKMAARHPQAMKSASPIPSTRARKKPVASKKPMGGPSCGKHAEPGPLLARGILGREEGRTAPFAPESDTLAEAKEAKQDRCRDPGLGIGG